MSPGKKKALTIAATAIFAVSLGVAWYYLGGNSPADTAAVRVFVCAETGKEFEHKIVENEEEPVKSPHSGKMTGYSGEPCYWTKDEAGKYKAKTKPTWVVLKKRINPESRERTYCPDCGKEVVGHNPLPPKKFWDAAVEEEKAKR